MSIRQERIKRQIHFFDMEFDFHPEFSSSGGNGLFEEVFRELTKLSKTKSKIRYQRMGEKFIYINQLKFIPTEKIIQGKLLSIRQDLFPEFINMTTDETEGIDGDKIDGIVDTTHFVIDYSASIKKMVFEYNHSGARVKDFVEYLLAIGKAKKMLAQINLRPVIMDDLSKVISSLNRCSEVVVKVHRDNIPQLKNIDQGLFTVVSSIRDHYDSEYITVTLKYDYKKLAETTRISNLVNSIARIMRRDPKVKNYFNEFRISGENGEMGNRLDIFDLLLKNQKKEISVLKNGKFRTVVSDDVFEKLIHSIKS